MKYWTLLKLLWPRLKAWWKQWVMESVAPPVPTAAEMAKVSLPAPVFYEDPVVYSYVEPAPLTASMPTLKASGSGSANTAQMIIGPPGMQHRHITAWLPDTAYTNGRVVLLMGGIYFCLTAGTSGSALPTNALGDITDNTVVWRRCLSGLRHGLILCNIDDTDALDFDFYPGGAGPRLNANGGTMTLTGLDCPQNAVYAITGGAGAASYRYTEW